MPTVREYLHGTPCWVDLATTDLAGARVFYAGLFGWEYVDEELGQMDNLCLFDGDAGRIGGD